MMRGLVEQVVEFRVQRYPLLRRDSRVDARHKVRDHTVQSSQILVRGTRDGISGRQPLEHETEAVDLLEVFSRESRDRRAAIATNDNQAFPFELGQSLADGAPADLQDVGQMFLSESIFGSKEAPEDRFPEPVRDRISEAQLDRGDQR
jgi:hypothetical protein